eukprot:21208-Eustigmatos_ZCMA.PRE.1
MERCFAAVSAQSGVCLLPAGKRREFQPSSGWSARTLAPSSFSLYLSCEMSLGATCASRSQLSRGMTPLRGTSS